MAPVDRLLRADRPLQTVPPAACPHQRTPIAPSWPPRIIAVTSEIRTGQRQELFFEVPIRIDHPVARGLHPLGALAAAERADRSGVPVWLVAGCAALDQEPSLGGGIP